MDLQVKEQFISIVIQKPFHRKLMRMHSNKVKTCILRFCCTAVCLE